MSGSLRLAIVGCGDIARWMALFSRLNRRIHLVACCDRTLPIAQAFAARFRIPRAHADYGTMLRQEGLDAVYLAVPHDLHAEMACAAVEAGIAVLVEKPLARTLAEGQELVSRVRAAGVPAGVNYQYRYDRGCYGLAQAARRGDLGELYYGSCNVPWHREADYFGQGPWRGELVRAGGTLRSRSVLSFKYWPDEVHPGADRQDSMCTWTENHQILFAAGAYLAGQLYPDVDLLLFDVALSSHPMCASNTSPFIQPRGLFLDVRRLSPA